MTTKVLNKIRDRYFDIIEEEVDYCDKKQKMVTAYSKEGKYIGDPQRAYSLLSKYNIQRFETISDNHKVCSIGFAPAKDPDSGDVDKWFGWSHRAIWGFKIGDIAKEGDCCCTCGILGEYQHLEENKEEVEAVIKPGFEAKTLDDCKKMAIAFANSIS